MAVDGVRRLERRRIRVVSPCSGHRMRILVDDLETPASMAVLYHLFQNIQTVVILRLSEMLFPLLSALQTVSRRRISSALLCLAKSAQKARALLLLDLIAEQVSTSFRACKNRSCVC